MHRLHYSHGVNASELAVHGYAIVYAALMNINCIDREGVFMADAVIPTWPKDPDATLDWVWDWSDWLAPGETITVSVMTVSAGLNLVSQSNTLSSATVWLSGGAPGTPYLVSSRITTSAGRIDERSITIRVKQR